MNAHVTAVQPRKESYGPIHTSTNESKVCAGNSTPQNLPNTCNREIEKSYSRRSVVKTTALVGGLLAAPWVWSRQATAKEVWCPLVTVSDWEKAFWARQNYKKWLSLSRSGDSLAYYSLAIGLDGYLAMFQATGKAHHYLNKALGFVFNVIDDAQPSNEFETSRFNDSYLSWLSSDQREQVSKRESYLWRYVCRLLRLMREDPNVYDNAEYRDSYDRILRFTEQHIFDKWYSRNRLLTHLYRKNPHMTAHWAYICLNLALLTEDGKRQDRCWTLFHNMNHGIPLSYPYAKGSSIRQQIIPHPTAEGGYFWDWDWDEFKRPGSDVPHAGNIVSYIVDCNELGYEWTQEDIDALLITLNRAIWPTGRVHFAKYIDGSGEGRGTLYDGWVKLGRYSCALQQRISGHTVGLGCQFYGNGALNAAFLELY